MRKQKVSLVVDMNWFGCFVDFMIWIQGGSSSSSSHCQGTLSSCCTFFFFFLHYVRVFSLSSYLFWQRLLSTSHFLFTSEYGSDALVMLLDEA